MISVIVPVYRVEPYLDKCVRSILDQTYTDLEVLLVDDESPDACPALCDAWAARDSRVRALHVPHGGLSCARNAGIEAARGELLSFVDSDDRLAPDMLETLYARLRETGADLALCNYARVREDGSLVKAPYHFREGVFAPKDFWKEYFSSRNDRGYYMVSWNKLYKRELFAQLRFSPGRIHEDLYLLYDLVAACGTIATSDKVGYYYLQRKTGIIGSGRSLKNLTAPEAYLNHAEKFMAGGEWYFAGCCLDVAIRNLLMRDYGEGGKKSPAFRAIHRRAGADFQKLFPRLSRARQLRFFLYFTCPPLARFAETWMERRRKAHA